MARQKWQCWRGLALLIINENWTFPPTCYLLPSQGDITLLAISLSDIRYPHHSSEIFPSVGPISQDSPPHLCHSVIRMLVQHSHMTGPEWRRKTITDGHYFCIGRFDQYVLQHWVPLVTRQSRRPAIWCLNYCRQSIWALLSLTGKLVVVHHSVRTSDIQTKNGIIPTTWIWVGWEITRVALQPSTVTELPTAGSRSCFDNWHIDKSHY